MDWVDVMRLSRDEGAASFGHKLDALRFQQVCAATLGRAVRAGAQQAGFAMVDNYYFRGQALAIGSTRAMTSCDVNQFAVQMPAALLPRSSAGRSVGLSILHADCQRS